MKKVSRRARWCCCSGCGLVLLVPLVALFLLFSSPPRPRPMTPEQHVAAAQKVETLRQQLTSLAKDAQRGHVRSFRIEISEDEMNELLQKDPEVKQIVLHLHLQDPYVLIDEGKVSLMATRSMNGIDVTSTVSLEPKIDTGGRIEAEVGDAMIGRLRLPDSVAQRLAKRVSRELAVRVNQNKVRLKNLTVEPGRIVAEGTTR